MSGSTLSCSEILFPPWFYNSLLLKFQLAKGLSYHFFFMWFFALNGVTYVLYTFLSGEWRNLAPNRPSLAEAVQVVLHDLGMSREVCVQFAFGPALR